MYRKKLSNREIKRAIKRSLEESVKTGFGHMLIDLSAEPWKKDDQEWFLANPLRSFRIRRLYEKEFPQEFNEGQTHVIVRQVMPGLRDKVFLNNPTIGTDFDNLPDIDEIGMILWEKINNGATTVSLDTVAYAASMMNLTERGVQ